MSFIMTMSSDEEGEGEGPTFPIPSTSKSTSNSTSNNNNNNKSQKLTRKEQLALSKSLKSAKAKKSTSKAIKRKRVENSESEGEGEGEEGGNAMQIGSEDEGGMAKDFIFDGLGGGFVGEKRMQVWDSGQSYIPNRPNAIPRVTVDEIIARRAPVRSAKSLARATKAAEAKLLLEARAGGTEDELELDMIEAMGVDEDDGDEGDVPTFADEEDFDSEEGDDDDEEDEDSEDGSGSGTEEEEEEVQESDPDSGFGDDDAEDWLRLGEVSEGEEAEGEKVDPSSAANVNEEEEDDGEAPTGFAALANLSGEMSDSSDSEDETPIDLRPTKKSTTLTKVPLDPAAVAEAAAAKAYFTSHSNISSSTNSTLSFSTLPSCTLSRPLLLSLASLNLSIPTPIQAECIPLAMLGHDIVASSRTGSGKTVAFWVGVLERLLHRDRRNGVTRVVVMTPTRELAVQVHGVGVALARYTDVQFCLCVGGLSLKVQEAELKLRPDIVVSTPGRLIDHVRNTPCFNMDGVEVLVLDEADRMLEEGFRAELEEIISAAPRSRQTLLFSATVTESVSSLSRLSMNKPVRVKIDEMGATAEGLIQEFLRVRGDKPGEAIERGFRSGERSREALLVSLCTRSFSSGRTIIFFRSKAQAHRMKILFSLLGEGLERSDELHGDLTQEARLNSLRRFREGESAFLLATDLASRGLDIKGIENVINYEMPRSIEIYLHRVGRTARAGKKGRALTLVGESDRKLVKLAMKHAPPETIKQRVIPPEVINEVTAELEELEGEVKAVQREEKEEKEYRRGDMELTKGRNMIEHEREIMARPARTWFQTTVEKAAAKSAGLKEHNSNFTEKKTNKRPAPEEKKKDTVKRLPYSGMSRKEKRRKMAADEDREDQLAEDRSASKQSIDSSIRSAKKAARAPKMTVVAADKVHKDRTKKKKSKGGFERELGINGRAERELGDKEAGVKEKRPGPKERKGMLGGSAGKGKQGGDKRKNKASTRS